MIQIRYILEEGKVNLSRATWAAPKLHRLRICVEPESEAVPVLCHGSCIGFSTKSLSNSKMQRYCALSKKLSLAEISESIDARIVKTRYS